VDGNIISATFLDGGFRFEKSILIPITFIRKNFKILNNKKINVPDSIRNEIYSYDYSYIIKTDKEKAQEKSKLKISYFLYDKYKIMYYCFVYKRKLDDVFYHYGVQIPTGASVQR
jgi:hypothetical protein